MLLYVIFTDRNRLERFSLANMLLYFVATHKPTQLVVSQCGVGFILIKKIGITLAYYMTCYFSVSKPATGGFKPANLGL